MERQWNFYNCWWWLFIHKKSFLLPLSSFMTLLQGIRLAKGPKVTTEWWWWRRLWWLWVCCLANHNHLTAYTKYSVGKNCGFQVCSFYTYSVASTHCVRPKTTTSMQPVAGSSIFMKRLKMEFSKIFFNKQKLNRHHQTINFRQQWKNHSFSIKQTTKAEVQSRPTAEPSVRAIDKPN